MQRVSGWASSQRSHLHRAAPECRWPAPSQRLLERKLEGNCKCLRFTTFISYSSSFSFTSSFKSPKQEIMSASHLSQFTTHPEMWSLSTIQERKAKMFIPWGFYLPGGKKKTTGTGSHRTGKECSHILLLGKGKVIKCLWRPLGSEVFKTFKSSFDLVVYFFLKDNQQWRILFRIVYHTVHCLQQWKLRNGLHIQKWEISRNYEADFKNK